MMWVLVIVCPQERTALHCTAVITLTLFIGYWGAAVCSTVQMHCTFLNYLTPFDCSEDKRHHCFGGIRQEKFWVKKQKKKYIHMYRFDFKCTIYAY